MEVLPQSISKEAGLQDAEQPTNTFLIDWTSMQIAGMDDGLGAMRQAVEITLQNERFRWQIYSSDFGSELEELAGEESDYIISDLPRRIEEAFSTDSRILSVENFAFFEPGDGSLVCTFDVVTVFGVTRQEVVL